MSLTFAFRTVVILTGTVTHVARTVTLVALGKRTAIMASGKDSRSSNGTLADCMTLMYPRGSTEETSSGGTERAESSTGGKGGRGGRGGLGASGAAGRLKFVSVPDGGGLGGALAGGGGDAEVGTS